ncbi:hypothetical protein WB66_07645 [bacteria symbiont BFo1 of Frankliniella occidentalis]|nr:hypothetical protein WB66_07645 [bacteria symbiont BFo1 of Frankliniella occidentalis]CAH0232662.1 Hydroxyethylthiazole kinase [Erwinia aphidicola]
MIQPQSLSHADVAQTFTANELLALGASPAMVIDPEVAAQFSTIADGLLINVGTLTLPVAEQG